MAILKDLIVHGSSRFLNKIYASEIQTPLIEAEAGIFKKLKADDATVVGLLDVKGQLHTNSWSNSNIATIDGSFYITPTIGSASGTVTITASTLTFSGTNYAVSSLYLGDGSSITWPQYSKVLVTGQILSNGEWIPLGTLLGQLSSTATAASISINNIKDNKNQTSNVLATLVSNGTTSSSYRNLKVSLYQRASSSTAFYPLGIYMTATGTNGRTFLDIYGGVEALSNSNNYGGFAQPNVRIGNLQGLPNVGGQTPSGWGIYTDNGYFKGIIAADKGFIGSGSKYWVIANEEDVSNVENSRSYIYNGKISYNDTTNDGVYLGTDGIGLGKGSFYVTKAGSLTAKSGSIGGWQLDANSFHTGTWGNDNSALICTGTGSSKSIGGSESIDNWVFTAGANFGVTKSGALYASSANISGKVVATSGSIGGVNIVDGNLDVSSISIGSLSGASNYAQKSYVDDAVDNIEIGGRNLLKNSNVVNTSLSDSVIGGTATRTIPSGTVITLSVQIDADDVVWGSSGNKRIGVASSVIKDSGGNQYIEAWAAMTGRTGTGIDKTFDTSFHGRVKSTYTLQGELPLDKVFTLYVQSVTSGTVSVSKPKLEIGNKATDWTPAPEDIEDNIEEAEKVATSYITQINDTGIKITPYDKSGNDYLQINSDAISMYRNNIETLKIKDDNIRVGKIGTNKRNVYITNNAVQIRNNTTVLASYGDSIVLGNESSLSQITLSQTGVVFTPKTVVGSTETAGTFKYIVNELGYSYTLVEESASNQSTGTATKDPLRLNNNTYYSNTESFSDVILAKVNNEFWVLGKTGETETSVAVQVIGTDSETWNYNSTPVTKTIVTYVTVEETQETTVEQEDDSEEIENIIVQVNYQITKVESWEKWNVIAGTISEDYVYSGYIKKDPSDKTNQDLYSISYQKRINTSQSSTGTTLNVNVSTDITTSLSFRQMTNFYEYKNFDYVTTEPDFSILFGKDVWTNSPYSYILGGEKNVIKTDSTIPALYSTIVGGYQNGYFYNKHSDSPSLEDTLRKMGIECFIGNGYGNSVQSNLSSIVGGQYNAIYDGESFSVIGGGYNNSIQTWYDDTIPNNTNFYNAPYQFLGGGKDNSSRSDYGVLVGGYNNINLGKYSVISGGASNKTVGQYSVITGGNNNIVFGENSYAHGYLNIAEGNNQTVLGKANIPDSTSLLIIGNGTNSSNRSNALTLSQSGNLTIAMDLNLNSPHAISLAQKSDYLIKPSNLIKSNRIWAAESAGNMNNYYTAQGYHSFYTNGKWTLSIEPLAVYSTVPLYAPNNIQRIDNTNNISRANVIYCGYPSTSDHPTANQPTTNGWYYYRQFAANNGYNILLGVEMNSDNPTLRIRSRYKEVSTQTYKWTGWKNFITSSYSKLTVTRVISTKYMSATDFARIHAYQKNGMLYLHFNALFNGSDYTISDTTTIATISNWNAIDDAIISIPCQNDGTKVMTITVTVAGAIKVYSAKAIHGWYRAFICVPSSS